MLGASVPSIDLGNPMYCPDITASRYLQQIRRMNRSAQHLNSFTRCLSRSLRESQNSSQDTSSCKFDNTFQVRNPQVQTPAAKYAENVPSSRKRKPENVESSSNEFHRLKKRTRSDHEQLSSFVLSPDIAQPYLPTLLNAATSVQNSSEGVFQELTRRTSFPMLMDDSRRSPRRFTQLECELYGHPIGAETPGSLYRLLTDLSRELPGIFLSHKLSGFDHVSHQTIVDLLGDDGYLTRHILEYFRGSFIEHLDLSASLSAADGLNELSPSVVLDIFSLPHSFTRLTALNLDDVRMNDFDLTKIHHLPFLSTLRLNNTCIGNEAIGHLTSLKYQLKELHIEDNPRITDDCIPSLCLFSSLVLLRIYGTLIKMPGLRRLAYSIQIAGRTIDIEIPKECEMYLSNLHGQYQLHPVAPLITDPGVCACLSVNALKANLAGHAVFNPSIYLSGSKPELIDRLRGILEIRQEDRVVKEIVWGYESSADYSSGENDGTESDISEL